MDPRPRDRNECRWLRSLGKPFYRTDYGSGEQYGRSIALGHTVSGFAADRQRRNLDRHTGTNTRIRLVPL
jgi:hypothetical protein